MKTDSAGSPLGDNAFVTVSAVHEMACRHDYDGLLDMMENPFGDKAPSEALRELRADGGAPLAALAQTLETAPISDQGGLIYCHPRGATAAFARGTQDRPGRWSHFTLTGASPMDGKCSELRAEQPTSSP
ncbi:hypothetical protein [Lentzea sp. NPDC003310]|uniref:hypothetical protein n=1 Tax=Lentzea sp. NPDC003310 TaxID=3154447 RepID=UPI00339F89AE